ncbi:hypothetical protein QUC31_016298 [Theobroma cacao]
MGTISCVSHGHFSNFTSFSKNSICSSSSASLPFFKNPIRIFKSFTFSSSMAASLRVSASSTIGERSEPVEAMASSGMVGENDLLIVGPGVLGRLVAEKWREENPGCQIYGQSVTTDHHHELMTMGINPFLKGNKTDQKFPYVIFCAPPSKTPDYPGDIRMAALSWNGEGSFLFTSSSAPFDCYDNGPCDEVGWTLYILFSDLNYEEICIHASWTCGCNQYCIHDDLNFSYKLDRGAHFYWLQKGTVDCRPDHILNLIHYEDAASLSVTILKKKLRVQIFLGCDNHPLSRQEVMDLVEKSGKFSKKFEAFTGTSDPLGKKLNNTKTRQELGWEPKYPSFANFLGVSE